ncbi:MAG: PTS sugar transporter subunit IIA, partial [Ralstonia sp.]
MASALICAERIRLQQRATDKESAIRAAGQLLGDAGCREAAYLDSLLRRDSVASPGLGRGGGSPR